MEKLFIIDAMAMIYRAYFAFAKNPMRNKEGKNTSAIYGFLNSIIEIKKKEQPEYLAIAFDTIAPTEREGLFPEYKANRDTIPEDIVASIPYIKNIMGAMKIPIYEKNGFEADDVMGTLAKQAEEKMIQSYLVSSDKDFAQLVSNNIFLYRPKRFGSGYDVLGINDIKEKWRVKDPLQVIDILGLWGDSVDNIPGVPGIGEVRAKELVGTYGSIENLIAHCQDLKGKMRDNIIKYNQQALLSKKLATIILDIPLSICFDDMKPQSFDTERLKTYFNDLGFKNLAQKILNEDQEIKEGKSNVLFPQEKTIVDASSDSLEVFDPKKVVYKLIEIADYQSLIKEISLEKIICIDTETTSLSFMQAQLVGLSLSYKPGLAYYIPFPKKPEEQERFIALSKQYLENEKIEKIGQNLKFDMHILMRYGIALKGKIHDTMMAHALIEPDKRHNMDEMAISLLNYQPISITTLIGTDKKQEKTMDSFPAQEIKDYACEDADISFQIYQKLEPRLKTLDLLNLYEKVECPLIPVLAQIEKNGVKIDVEFLNHYAQQLEKEAQGVETKIFEFAGEPFNIASAKKLGTILFDRLKILDNPQKTKTGQYKTDELVLRYLKDKHAIVAHILDFREIRKLNSTYVAALPKLNDPITGRLHTTFNQSSVITGRLSSNKPNLQNIPIKTKRGRLIRKAFIPQKGYRLLSADYSQIEIRIMAGLSQDASLLNGLFEGKDIHAETAANIFDVPIGQVSAEQRRRAKAINFGIIYGQTPFGLSQSLSIARKEAQEIMEQYFSRYSGVKAYIEKVKQEAKKNGYVSTQMGRRRYLQDINSGNKSLQSFAERNAINMPIQGTAAEMIKIAMIAIANAIEKEGLESKMILQVHDELLFEVPENEMDDLKSMVENAMVNALDINSPVKVEMGVGKNWLDAH